MPDSSDSSRGERGAESREDRKKHKKKLVGEHLNVKNDPLREDSASILE